MIQNKLTPWRRFLSLLELDIRDIKQIFYYAIFAGLVALSLPLGIQAIINLIQSAQVTTSWVVLVVLVTLGVAFQGVLQLMQFRILENIQQKIFARSSFEFAYRFPKIKIEALRNVYPPELANRFFDTIVVQKGLSKILIDFPAAILQIIFGLILLSFYHSFFIIYGIILLGLIFILYKYSFQRGLETSIKESKSKYDVAHWIQEIARSLISFKLSGKTTLAMKRNDDLTANYLLQREKHFKVLWMQFVQMIGFKVMVTAGLLLIGGLLVLNQQMNIGQFVAAEIIILLVISSVEKVIRGLDSFYDVLTSLEKIGQMVDKDLEKQNGIDPFAYQSSISLEIDNLKYKFPKGDEIIKNINFKISPRDRIHLAGLSGSGKTTLLKIISGLIEPTGGAVYVNDISIEAVWPNKYRASIGQVLPDQTPFEGSILENIAFSNNEISEARIQEVLKHVGLNEFVKHQPQGIHTVIYPEGKQIPFTITKRILLARAIINKPKLLILKDPLEHFENDDAQRIIDYLVSPEHEWALIVSSNNEMWKAKCATKVELKDGYLINKAV